MTNPLSDPVFVAGLRPIPSGADGSPPSWPAVDLVGTRPDGTPVSFDIGAAVAPVLLVFLSTNCDGCDVFWKGLAEPPAGLEVVVVTKGPDPATAAEVAALSSGLSGVPVVMSDAAWTDYRVTGYPFLVLVEPGTRTVLGESVGFRWSDLEALRSKLPGG
jgi:hypothetical protein